MPRMSGDLRRYFRRSILRACVRRKRSGGKFVTRARRSISIGGFSFHRSKRSRERQDLPMKLSSLIALGAAILPFAAVFALCVSLLAFPSSQRARVTYPTPPQVSELEVLPLASAKEPS